MGSVRELNIVIAGVGGQGQLFLSRLVAETFLRYGVPSMVAETHGMSQRGGSVLVHVRVGKDVRAPLIPKGRADIMLGMELIETARYVDYVKEGGVILANDKMIVPPGQHAKVERNALIEYVSGRSVRLYLLPSSSRAASLGIPLSANVHIFGALVALLELAGIFGAEVDSLVEALLPRRFLTQNTVLYKLGKEDLKSVVNPVGLTGIQKLLGLLS
jgi:indolepyruvate ferredoxin oxidoreductase beta subunit